MIISIIIIIVPMTSIIYVIMILRPCQYFMNRIIISIYVVVMTDLKSQMN